MRESPNIDVLSSCTKFTDSENGCRHSMILGYEVGSLMHPELENTSTISTASDGRCHDFTDPYTLTPPRLLKGQTWGLLVPYNTPTFRRGDKVVSFLLAAVSIVTRHEDMDCHWSTTTQFRLRARCAGRAAHSGPGLEHGNLPRLLFIRDFMLKSC